MQLAFVTSDPSITDQFNEKMVVNEKSVLVCAVFLSGLLSAKSQTFTGIWKELDAQNGYESFGLSGKMEVGLCVAEEKFTHTSIVGDRLEDYDYGTGDRLSLLDSETLLKEVNKGVDYRNIKRRTMFPSGVFIK